MNTQTITPEVRTIETRFGPMKVASQRMFFNGTLCEVTITDNPDYWTGEGMKGMYKYQIWDTYAMLTSERDGMNDALRVHAEELIIRTEMGDYRVRQARPNDLKLYGVNNWKGLYMEPLRDAETENRLQELYKRLDELQNVMVNTHTQQRDRNREMFNLAAEIEKIENPNSYNENKSHWEGHENRY